VDRPLVQADGGGGAGHRVGDLGLLARRHARWRHVDGLGEERAVERIRLVEQRQRVQLPSRQQALEGQLRSGHELLHDDVAGRVRVDGGHRRIGQQAGQPLGPGDQLHRPVGAHDPAAGRQVQRLDHDRIAGALCGRTRVGPRRHDLAGRLRQPGRAHRLAKARLVRRRARRRHRGVRQAQPRGHQRRDERRLLVGGDHAVDGLGGRVAQHLFGRPVRVAKIERQRAGRPHLCQHVAAIAAQERLDAETLRRARDVVDLVGGGGGQDQDTASHARSQSPGCSAAASSRAGAAFAFCEAPAALLRGALARRAARRLVSTPTKLRQGSTSFESRMRRT
jgi:hypothetical protein